MGFFDFLKKKDRENTEPTLTIEEITEDDTTESSKNRRGRGGGTENPNDLQKELEERQKAFDDYREKMLSGELGDEFGGGQGQEALDELSRLDSLVKETQQKIGGRDERNLGREEGLTAGAVAGGAMAGGNALASGVAGAGGLGMAGEALSEQAPFESEGELGGQQRPTEFTIDTDEEEEQEETILSADPKGEKGKLGKFLGNLFGRKKGDTELGMSGMTGEPLIPREETEDTAPRQEHETHDQAKQEQEQFAGVHPDGNVDIESKESASFSQSSDPFIETGKETPIDATIFRSMIHEATKISYLFLKETGLSKNFFTLADTFVPFELKKVVDSAINTLETTRIDDIGSLRASSKTRMKFNIQDKKHDIINNAVLYPFLVVALNFYMVKNEGDLIQFNWIMKQGVAYVMKNYLKIPSNKVDYFLKVYSAFPQSLNTAFMRNSQNINIVNDQEKKDIQNFILRISVDYNRAFPNEPIFFEALKKYEHGGRYLFTILKNLQSPQFLFEINKSFETIDNFIANVKNNKDVLIGLMGLIYAEARNEGNLLNEAIISNAMIDGIVYYKKKVNRIQKRDLDVELMLQMGKEPNKRKLEGFDIKYNTDKLAEFENKEGDTTILFRGTNFREKDFLKKDFIQNVLNFAGSPEIFTADEYNERYSKATQLILEKQREISNSGKGSLKVQGYSLGGIGAMYVSILFPNIPVKVYNPVISNTELTREMIQELVNRNSNIEFFAVQGDPISNNLAKFKDKLKITYIKKSKFFSAHSLENYLY